TANQDQVEHLERHRIQLEEKTVQFKSLSAQFNALTTSKQEVNKGMRTLFREIETLVAFLRAGVRQHYGKDSEKLIEFGLQPFRGLRTPAPKPTLPEAPAPSDRPCLLIPRSSLTQGGALLSAPSFSTFGFHTHLRRARLLQQQPTSPKRPALPLHVNAGRGPQNLPGPGGAALGMRLPVSHYAQPLTFVAYRIHSGACRSRLPRRTSVGSINSSPRH
ncbi:MAG TPA: hypothetical protein VF179_19900, partial [Thermoanaerobaculia bacterium]|nr:hypothetical protein [Thermoanaerobaculia bacterium]